MMPLLVQDRNEGPTDDHFVTSQPRKRKAPLLGSLSCVLFCRNIVWSHPGDSNPRPTDYKSDSSDSRNLLHHSHY